MQCGFKIFRQIFRSLPGSLLAQAAGEVTANVEPTAKAGEKSA